jgi:excisionase family DNA binding protein
MVYSKPGHVTVKEASELTGLHMSSIYLYLQKGLIKGAKKFAGTTWLVPKEWIKRYKAGKIQIKGAFAGQYNEKKRNNTRKYRAKKKRESK